jgi:predicted transcriptional regulator
MRTYLHQLQALAADKGTDLKECFLAAGVPDSTYYRAMNGAELKFVTACRVEEAIRTS